MTGFMPTDDEATVRVVPGRGHDGSTSDWVAREFEPPSAYDHPGEPQAQMTEAQATLIQILERAEEAASAAKAQAEAALDWLDIVKAPANRQLPTLLGQLVEEIREVRRMRV